MSIKGDYSINLVGGILIIEFLNSPTPDEYCHVVELVANLNSNQFRLWDLSCGISWSDEEVKIVTKHSELTLNVASSKIAIVASDDLTFGLFNVHGGYRAGFDHEQVVFRERKEAEKWLYDQRKSMEN